MLRIKKVIILTSVPWLLIVDRRIKITPKELKEIPEKHMPIIRIPNPNILLYEKHILIYIYIESVSFVNQ